MGKFEIQKAIETAREELAKNEEGRIPYKFRREILKALDSQDGADQTFTKGHLRRFNLARSCVNHVLPVWKDAFPENKGVEKMLMLAQQVMNTEIEKDSAKKTAYNYWSEVDSLDTETENQQRAASVGYASINAVNVAVRDELLDKNIEDDFDEDPYGWDTAFHAFLAYTGFGGENPDGIEKNREFWKWYLNEAVPRAYQSVS